MLACLHVFVRGNVLCPRVSVCFSCLSLIYQQISALQTVVHEINETLNQAVALSGEEFNKVYTIYTNNSVCYSITR